MPTLISAAAHGCRTRSCRAPLRVIGARQGRCRRAVLVMTIAAVFAASGCGKKGPPLPPLSNRPRAPEAVSASRVGDQVYVRFTIPRANQSGVQPANIERVDVYALTGPRLPLPRFLETATVVASIPVRRPPPEGEQPSPPPAQATDQGALDQGAQAVVVEPLTEAAFEPATVRESKPAAERPRGRSTGAVIRRTPLDAPEIGPPMPRPPTRYYSAVGVNRSGRRGSPSALVAVTLGPALPAPPQPTLQVRREGVEISWASPPGLRRPVLESEPGEVGAEVDDENGGEEPAAPPAGRDDPSETAGRAEGPIRARSLLPWAAVRSGYNVYTVPPADQPPAKPSPHALAGLPQLLNPRPLTRMRFVDSTAAFGQSRCYVVRLVEIARQSTAESPSSAPACADVADVFAPSPPKSLAAVSSEGSISLIWEASSDSDLGGYLVLRGEAGSDRLQPVTPQPIKETTWRDTTAKRGVRYAYEVIAVDTATPPNRSGPSNRVEETAR